MSDAQHYGLIGGKVKLTQTSEANAPFVIDVSTEDGNVQVVFRELRDGQDPQLRLVLAIEPAMAKTLAHHLDQAAWTLDPSPWALGVGGGEPVERIHVGGGTQPSADVVEMLRRSIEREQSRFRRPS